MRQGLLLALAGIAAGLCAALIMTRLLENALYKTGSRDLATFVLAPVVFLLGGGVCQLSSRTARHERGTRRNSQVRV